MARRNPRWRSDKFYCLACRRERERYEPDDVKVERAVAGDPPAWLHPEERRRVVLILRSKGPQRVSLAETARRAMCTVTQVCRIQKNGRGDVW